MSKLSKFWKKVILCNHEFYGDYAGYIYCETPYCEGYELHCKKCNAYISKCDCGYCNGVSGWSEKRWINRRKKDEKKVN